MVQQNGPSGAPVEPSISGDAVRVDVSVYLNDVPQSGFSVDFAAAVEGVSAVDHEAVEPLSLLS